MKNTSKSRETTHTFGSSFERFSHDSRRHFATARSLAMRRRDREKESEGRASKWRHSRPAREERRCGLSTRCSLRLDACACLRQLLLPSPQTVLPATRRSTQRRCSDGGTSSASHDSVLALLSVSSSTLSVRVRGVIWVLRCTHA